MSVNTLPNNFPDLVRTYGDKAYGFAFRLTHNEADARDLVQEAFTKALKNFDKFDKARAFEPWFFRIMKNIFLDWMRRYERKYTTSIENTSPNEDRAWEEILPSAERSPDVQMERSEEASVAMKALDSLPAHYKTAITLCDIEKYSYEAIAKVMDCPVGTIRSRIHQGRVLLRQTYEKMLYQNETVQG
jgi:RNA polymerase sigma-70 factor (ECF subfamily)